MAPMRLCIDFGSAYTKIALRPDWDAATKMLGDESLNLDELHLCIPSVVACDQRGAKTLWAWGLQAADLKEGNGIKVYRNWKRHFFTAAPKLAVPSPALVSAKKVDALLERLDALDEERGQLISQIATIREINIRDVTVLTEQQQLSVAELRAVVGKVQTPPSQQESSQGGATTDLEMREAAMGFFRGLWEFVGSVLRQRSIKDVGQVPTRLCVPAFNGSARSSAMTASEELLVEILKETGWHIDPSRPVVSEPAANAIGVFTRGANQTRCLDSDGGRRILNMGQMFGGGAYHQAVRDYVLNFRLTPPRSYVALVVDVGAYTADFATLVFDLHDNDLPPTASTHSEPLGIAQLDQRIAESLLAGKQKHFTSLDTRDLETLKRQLYTDLKPFRTGAWVIGEGQEQAIIRDRIEDFARQVADAACLFLRKHDLSILNEVILTGGGNNIPLVASTVIERLREWRPRVVRLPIQVQAKAPGKMELLGQRLVRGASAVGGASVFFDGLKWTP